MKGEHSIIQFLRTDGSSWISSLCPTFLADGAFVKCFVSALIVLCYSRAELSATEPASIARIWDEETLAAIRIDRPNPPVHARNLFHLSVAMYDAWAAYDDVAVGILYHEKHRASDIEEARREAISFAAYRVLVERYALAFDARRSISALNARLSALGYNPENTSADTSTPAGIGNRVASRVSDYFLLDGARQLQFYGDLPPSQGGYKPVNAPLLLTQSGTVVVDVNHWQPLTFTEAAGQNGTPADTTQRFLGSQWIDVRAFALERENSRVPWIDPGPPPHLGGLGDSQFRQEVVSVILASSQLTVSDGAILDISPRSLGNNSLGSNDGRGYQTNPATGRAYTENLVKLGDFARVLAEFWADGPQSETPPGHWNVIANKVSDSPDFSRRIEGSGRLLSPLEWDVKIYLALNAALHDAACAAWSLKRYYDGWRPIEAVRYMGGLGQSSDPSSSSFHTNGLPLIPGLIELVTEETAAPGGRHYPLRSGTVAIKAWAGPPPTPASQVSGVRWIAAVDWLPYQKATFVTPAFPGYISGHSTFSRAAAEVLAAATGSVFFPGGLATYDCAQSMFLKFESGPSGNVQLQWATYFDAADQAGASRVWGGIHPPVDDFTGRRVGATVGRQAWRLARLYFNGEIVQRPSRILIQPLDSETVELRCNTLQGFSYHLQSTPDIAKPFTQDDGAFGEALGGFMTCIIPKDYSERFFRVVSFPTP